MSHKENRIARLVTQIRERVQREDQIPGADFLGPGLLLLPGLAAAEAGPASILAWIALLGLSGLCLTGPCLARLKTLAKSWRLTLSLIGICFVTRRSGEF